MVSQLENELDLVRALDGSPVMQLKPKMKSLLLTSEFGVTDAVAEENRILNARSLVKIVETRREPDYGPLWSMVVAIDEKGAPVRTSDGRLIRGWGRTDCFAPPDSTKPVVKPSPKVTVPSS